MDRWKICDELRKRSVDLCCQQEVRLRVRGARLTVLQDSKYKLWWSENKEGYGGVGALVSE